MVAVITSMSFSSIAAVNFLPYYNVLTQEGNNLVYQVNDGTTTYTETFSVLSGTTNINGITATVLQVSREDDPSQYTSYFFSNNEEGLDYLGMTVRQELGEGNFIEKSYIFDPPIRYLNSEVSIGDSINSSGRVIYTYTDSQGSRQEELSYTNTVNIEAAESIYVQSASYNTIRVKTTLTMSDTSNTENQTQTNVSSYWYAPFIGIVKSTTQLSDDRQKIRELLTSNIYAPDIEPKIYVNDQRWAIVAGENEPISAIIGLNAWNFEGIVGDWWVAAESDGTWYSYVYPTGWEEGIKPAYQGPFFSFSEFTVFNANLPQGLYNIYFAVDTNPNGVVDFPMLWYDSAQVHVAGSLSEEVRQAANILLSKLTVSPPSEVMVTGPVEPGTVMREIVVSDETPVELTVPETAGTYYLFFIDDEPQARYEHPVRYAWVELNTEQMQYVSANERPFIERPGKEPGPFVLQGAEVISDVHFMYMTGEGGQLDIGESFDVSEMNLNNKKGLNSVNKYLQYQKQHQNATNSSNACKKLALVLDGGDHWKWKMLGGEGIELKCKALNIAKACYDDAEMIAKWLAGNGFEVTRISNFGGVGVPPGVPSIDTSDDFLTQLENLAINFEKNGCRKDCCHELFIFMTGHGSSENTGFIICPKLTYGIIGKSGEWKPLNPCKLILYYDIFEKLKQVLPSCVKVTLFIDACYSGKAIFSSSYLEQFCEEHCALTIITSTDREHKSHAFKSAAKAFINFGFGSVEQAKLKKDWDEDGNVGDIRDRCTAMEKSIKGFKKYGTPQFYHCPEPTCWCSLDGPDKEHPMPTPPQEPEPEPQPPAAPSELKANRAECKIILNWKDNSDDEEYFLIERLDEDKLSVGEWKVIGIADRNKTTYTDNDPGLVHNKLYCYRVRAVKWVEDYPGGTGDYVLSESDISCTRYECPSFSIPTISLNNQEQDLHLHFEHRVCSITGRDIDPCPHTIGTFTISNSGGGTLSWEIQQELASGLFTFIPDQETAPTTVTVQYNCNAEYTYFEESFPVIGYNLETNEDATNSGEINIVIHGSIVYQ